MNHSSPVLMIGLDAADAALIDSLCEEGRLPALQSLRAQGCFGRLESDATKFSGGVWPTLYTSSQVPWHGVYHNRIWRQERMRVEHVNAAWLPETPFWEHLSAQGFRTTIIDVPLVLRHPVNSRANHVMGWGAHDLMARSSWPTGLWKTLETAFGPPQMPQEQWGSHTAQSLLGLRDRLLRTTDQMGRIAEFLLRWQPSDLFLLILGATHRGGHYLWDLSQIDDAGRLPSTRRFLEHALTEIYQACDAVVGRLVSEVPAGTRIIVFAVHGMGANSGWEDRCADILSHIQRARNELPKGSPLYTPRSKGILRSIKHHAKRRLPAGVIDRLFSIPRLRELDWRSLRYFSMPMADAGYVRINLKGRELQGVVQPGREYDALCRELAESFLSYRDTETGDPIVSKVYRMDDIAPPEAPYRTRLPDLVIAWGKRSAIHSRGIRSDAYGEIHWPDGRLTSGRSGGHRDGGWFVAVGPGIPRGSRADGNHIMDIAPTVFRWLEAEPVIGFQGFPIASLLQTKNVRRPTAGSQREHILGSR